MISGGASRASQTEEPGEYFEMQVRPLLERHCFSCHTTSRLGGLAMTSRESLLQGGNSGPAIVPGQPEQSLLIQAVRHTHARLKMPPAGKLSEEEIAKLVTWIRMGAIWPGSPTLSSGEKRAEQRAFWAFQPIRRPALPKVKDSRWPRSPVDYFTLSELEARGLRPAPLADRRTLIRRASFDLIGLPPTPEEVDDFVKDSSPDAFAKVVDRLLSSPHYGERWGRYWLDIARYSDDRPNAFRYRDWVVQAFNEDMPYDLFIKAQIAGDLLEGPERRKYLAGLGLYALPKQSITAEDDRVDVTTRGFLGLTVACARCHDHKYDPIPTKDFYSLAGVFESTEYDEFPLSPESAVAAYRKQKEKVEEQEAAIARFLQNQSSQVAEILSARTADYIVAAWKVLGPDKGDVITIAKQASLDRETLQRWVKYLQIPSKEHPYLKVWDEALARGYGEDQIRQMAEEFQRLVNSTIREKRAIDEKNDSLTRGIEDPRVLNKISVLSLDRDRYFLWKELVSDLPIAPHFKSGIIYYKDREVLRFLPKEWRDYLASMQRELKALKSALPPQYPFLHIIRDSPHPANMRVHIRGNPDNLGEEAPRRFLSVLSRGEPPPFTRGSGRLELAEAIASADNPLTARVMANRIWQYHFGQGIVRTPSNFGQLGDRPSHPELLDYLASRLIENGWSIKSLHKEIMLSATYALSAGHAEKNYAADPDNRLLWRANRRRLDVEALRDSLLYVSGNLNRTIGGPPVRLDEETNNRRTVYGHISRDEVDRLLALFDFPNPAITSEQRSFTDVPLQRLFFLNSDFVLRQARSLAARLQNECGDDDGRKIVRAYRLLFGRLPTAREKQQGLQFLRESPPAWPQYAQVLMSSNEFFFID